MKYDFFEHINSLNVEDGVYPWNYVKVTGLNETKGTISFRGSKSKDVDERDLGEEITMNGNIFIDQVVKYHMLYVFNPEVLKDSSYYRLHGYLR